MPLSGGLGLAVRVGLATGCLAVCLNERLAAPLLELVVPLQRGVYLALMPDFKVLSFAVEPRGAHLKVRAVTQSRRYLVLGGRAHAPGIGFDVETPARPPQLYATLILTGALLTVPTGAPTLAALIAVAGALIMAVMPVPLILAGEQWGVVMAGEAGPSLEGALVGASAFVLQGGGLVCCALVLWAIAAAGRRHRAQRHSVGVAP